MGRIERNSGNRKAVAAIDRAMADKLISDDAIRKSRFDLVRLRVKPSEGAEIEREIVSHPSGAAVLPFDRERKVALLITGARPPVHHAGEPRMPEAVGGVIEDGSPQHCAGR